MVHCYGSLSIFPRHISKVRYRDPHPPALEKYNLGKILLPRGLLLSLSFELLPMPLQRAEGGNGHM